MGVCYSTERREPLKFTYEEWEPGCVKMCVVKEKSCLNLSSSDKSKVSLDVTEFKPSSHSVTPEEFVCLLKMKSEHGSEGSSSVDLDELAKAGIQQLLDPAEEFQNIDLWNELYNEQIPTEMEPLQQRQLQELQNWLGLFHVPETSQNIGEGNETVHNERDASEHVQQPETDAIIKTHEPEAPQNVEMDKDTSPSEMHPSQHVQVQETDVIIKIQADHVLGSDGEKSQCESGSHMQDSEHFPDSEVELEQRAPLQRMRVQSWMEHTGQAAVEVEEPEPEIIANIQIECSEEEEEEEEEDSLDGVWLTSEGLDAAVIKSLHVYLCGEGSGIQCRLTALGGGVWSIDIQDEEFIGDAVEREDGVLLLQWSDGQTWERRKDSAAMVLPSRIASESTADSVNSLPFMDGDLTHHVGRANVQKMEDITDSDATSSDSSSSTSMSSTSSGTSVSSSG